MPHPTPPPAYLQRDCHFMTLALQQARQAALLGEIPVGAVIVQGETVIAAAHNRRELDHSAIAHAEVLAIQQACLRLGSWRLEGCQLYVTLEPCPMCAGAILNARLDRVVYGARDEKAGCCGSVADLFAMPFNHQPVVRSGILAQECGRLLSGFFSGLRE